MVVYINNNNNNNDYYSGLLKRLLIFFSRSQWKLGLRHELSSPSQTLGSWVLVPLEAWLFVSFYCVFVLSCVSIDHATGWSPTQGVLPTVCVFKKL
jgi:hypothetical protein